MTTKTANAPARSRSPKEVVRGMLNRLPHNVGYERILYHVYVCQHIGRGLRQAEAGNTLSHAEVRKRLNHWVEESKRRAARAIIRQMKHEESRRISRVRSK